MPDERNVGPYQLFMLALCLYVLAALAAQTLILLDPETVRILDIADFGICLIFLVDFIRSLVLAPNRLQYLVRWGWIDLLSSIPAIDVFRWGRAARIFRILRILRGVRAARVLSIFAMERRASSALSVAVLVAILVLIFGSIAVLQLETGPDANIRDADDALWWAFVTITTVGYGDHYPVSPAGKVLAAAMMVVGIALFGTFTAYVASAFVAAEEEQGEGEIGALREEIRELRAAMEARR